jgi:hypothetical protein
MNVDQLKASLSSPAPPDGLSLPLQAMWWQAKGDWQRAHEAAQQDEGEHGCWVHAHLHRVEGDLSNAGYWYRRAGRPAETATLDAEWETIVAALP